MTKQPTIKDVAKAAGVSIGSVSNVINNSSSVKAETEAKVRNSMVRLGYRPNAAAQSMRTRSTRAIAFVVNDISNPIYSAIAKASEGLLNKHGYHLLLVDSDNRPGQEVEIFETLSGRVDAVVTTLNDEQDKNILHTLKNIDMPVVLLDREVIFDMNSVCIDYEKGMSKAVKYLSDLGHQSISLICAETKIRPGRSCIAGFNRAIRKQDLDISKTSIHTGILATDFGYQQTIDLLKQTKPPTALIYGGNRLFAGALKAIKDLDLKVPDQLSVIAFDDTELAELTTPSYTVLARDINELGTSIGELVIHSLHNKENIKTKKIILGAELLVRESCSKPPRNKIYQRS